MGDYAIPIPTRTNHDLRFRCISHPECTDAREKLEAVLLPRNLKVMTFYAVFCA